VDHVVEQRVSNLAQGLLILGTMTGPLLIVLHLIPQGVLAGLFFVMGTQALVGNGITQKIPFLARDKSLTSSSDPLARLDRKAAIYAFVAIELLGFGATFAITQTIAAIGFPVIILLLIPVRTFVMPRYFRAEELRALDAPTAGAFVMESVGGAYGEDAGGPTSNVNANGNGMGSGESSTPVPSDAESAIDDSLERGESYELRSQISRQNTTERPPDLGMRRRSRSSAGMGVLR
jgi:boron transporter